jgi:putative protease
VEKELTQSYTDKNFKKRIPLRIHVKAALNRPLFISVSDNNHVVVVESESVLEPARERPVSEEDIKDELCALSATCFIALDFHFEGEGEFFIHQKELKALRRKFTEELMKKRIERAPIMLSDYSLPFKRSEIPVGLKLNILLREFAQVKDLIAFLPELNPQARDCLGVIYLDYEFGKNYGESTALLREAGLRSAIATTRILKPNEYYNFKVIERARPDVILCRNLGAVQYFQDGPFQLKGDFSLNVTNSLTADYFLSKKLETVCASYDLNARQLQDLLSHVPAGKLEVTVHQYMPSFHMEHCVFAAFLSSGSSFRDCGKPCEKHRVELKDQFGNFHQIKADQECRNTMFNATSQSAAKLIPEWKKAGLAEFRFEALYERGHELKQKILSYLDIILSDSLESNEQVLTKLGVMEKYGLSDKVFLHKNHQNRKK